MAESLPEGGRSHPHLHPARSAPRENAEPLHQGAFRSLLVHGVHATRCTVIENIGIPGRALRVRNRERAVKIQHRGLRCALERCSSPSSTQASPRQTFPSNGAGVPPHQPITARPRSLIPFLKRPSIPDKQVGRGVCRPERDRGRAVSRKARLHIFGDMGTVHIELWDWKFPISAGRAHCPPARSNNPFCQTTRLRTRCFSILAIWLGQMAHA